MPSRCTGVVAAACTQGKRTQHGKPQCVIRDDQPDAREGRAGRVGVAERPVIPMKQWPLFRITDHAVAQVAFQLIAQKRLWLPGMSKADAVAVKLCKLDELGEVGPYHLDIDGSAVSGGAA